MISLDTNAVVTILKGRLPLIRRRLDRELRAETVVALSAIVRFELQVGVVKSVDPGRNALRLARFLSGPISVWPFDADDAGEAAEIRAHLERRGTPIGPYDVLIAAQARRRGALLVTANMREFVRVPGLRVADWTLPDAS